MAGAPSPAGDPAAPPRHMLISMSLVAFLFLAAVLAIGPQQSWAHFVRLTGWSSGTDGVVTPIGEEVPLEPAQINELVEMTGINPARPEIAGEDAFRLNANIPFAGTPILAARPFALPATPDRAAALKCMTQAIYYEAGFEPESGRRAVAQVILNRMRHPAFPKSVCGVIYQGSAERVCQFSFTCDGSLARAPAPGAWIAARRIAEQALAGRVETSVGMATHYHADYVSPYWAPRLAKLIQIGSHIFYRWPGAWGMPAAFGGRYAGKEAIPSVSTMPYGDAGDPTLALAKATLPANLVPERRADNDIGGRIDVTKGWKLDIPLPSDTRRAAAAIAASQTGRDHPSPAPSASRDTRIVPAAAASRIES